MLDMADYESLRRLHEKGWGIRKLAREFGHDRKTIRKALNEWDGSAPQYTLKEGRPSPVITAEVREFAHRIIIADKTAPRKQRHSALRIFERLKKEKSFQGGQSTVRRLVRQLRASERGIKGITTPLAFSPGEELQVDWGYAKVEITGVEVTVCLLLMTLCYSRRTFVRAFPAENQQCFLEGHLEGFEYLGGLPGRCAYDNLGSAVKKVFIGSDREENEEFLRFRTFHVFEPRFCTPGIEGAHEKGRVERRVDLFRSSHLVPVPKVANWAELDALVLSACQAEDQKAHPDQPDLTVSEVFEQERAALKPLPQHRYHCCKCDTAKADGHARICYETNLYSLPCTYGRRRVELRAYHDRIEFLDGVQTVMTWERSYKKREEKYDYRHYIPLLARAPGATLNGKPYDFMPEVLLRYRHELSRRLERRAVANSMSRVLLLLLKYPETEVLEAVELALVCGTVDHDSVKNILLQMRGEWTKPVSPLDLSGCSTEVQELQVKLPSLDRYDTLMVASR